MERKRIFVTMMVTVIASICLMAGCSKEQVEDYPSVAGTTLANVSGIANHNNPYDYCGRIHNEILDYIISNNAHPTERDIFSLSQEYLQSQYGISTTLTFEDVNSQYGSTTDFIINAILNNVSFDTVFNNAVVAEVFDTLVAYANSIMELLLSGKTF